MAHEMKVLLTVFDSYLAAMPRVNQLVTPFNKIARYVEHMLNPAAAEFNLAATPSRSTSPSKT